MRAIVVFLLLICAGWVQAETGSAARLAQLETALTRVQQEQQSVYQQFQMVQELRRGEMQAALPRDAQGSAVAGMQGLPSIDYDVNVRQQRERQERFERSGRELNALYARYVELAAQRKALLDQILDLSINPKN
ncbi:MAG: hypothetical protein A2045_06745 [Rhodocyclales bacterium GWA2_65_20]|nr:MAG: hypothetical protein A2045_06745 [Rhodocyclales bacterium GWA2_65_20]